MWLIVGLGNPGAKYQWNRHNIGFLAVEAFAKGLQVPPPEKKEAQALVSKFKLDGEDVILALPQTFMNLSGQSVQKLIAYYKVPQQNLVVLHDEIDQEFGKVKLQKARGHAGHNGIRNIHQQLGSNDYMRLRIGVGRPDNPRFPVADYVLANFGKDEMAELPDILDHCGDILEDVMRDGFEAASKKS